MLSECKDKLCFHDHLVLARSIVRLNVSLWQKRDV